MAKIGTVSPSRREITPAQGANNPFQRFQPLIANLEDQAPAYASIANQVEQRSVADTNMSLAIRAREEKVLSSRLTSEFIGIKNQLGRGLIDAYDAAEPGHAGFSTAAAENADKAFTKFMEKVPERLKPQFEADIAMARESLTNQAFDLQVQSENGEFKRNAIDYSLGIMEQFNTSVISDPAELDEIEADALEELDKLFASSPLDKASAEELKKTIITNIKSAKLGRVALEQALDGAASDAGKPGTVENTGVSVRSQRPVAGNLSAAMVGVLTAISGPESEGEYNVMYSPDGRRYFSDFSQHPNDGAVIASGPNAGEISTAAGKYQFIYSTWKEAQQALNLPDFSPQSQDLAAAWYANKIYKEATGRDLEAVIASGHAPSIAEARRILAADNGWEGLKNVTDQEFIETVTGATGNLSSLLYSPEYASIPMQNRVAIVNDAMAQGDAIIAQRTAQFQQQREAALNQLSFGLSAGSMGQQEILSASAQWSLSFEEVEKMNKIMLDKQGTVIDAKTALDNLSDPNYAFDPDEDKPTIDALFKETGMGAQLAAGNEEYLSTFVIPSVAKTGYIPAVLASALSTQMLSSNAQTAEFAMRAISMLQQTNGAETVRVFGKEAVAAAGVYNMAKAYIPQDQLMRYVRNELNPQDRQIIEERQKAIDRILTDSPQFFAPNALAREFEGYFEDAPPVDPVTGTALSNEFRSLFTYFYSATGDADGARDRAVEMMKTQWGTVQLDGDSTLIKYPPQLAGVKAFNGSYAWIERNLAAEVPLPAGVKRRLVSDARTEADIAAGRTPSYRVAVLDSNGLMRGVTILDTAMGKEIPPKMLMQIGNLPVRYSAEFTDRVRVSETAIIQQEVEDARVEPRAFGNRTSVGTAIQELFSGEPGPPKTLAQPEIQMLDTIGRLTGRADLVTNFSTAEDRSDAFDALMAELNAMPPGPVPLQLRRQLSAIYWRLSN